MSAVREPAVSSLLREAADLVRQARRKIEEVVRRDPGAIDAPLASELAVTLEVLQGGLEDGARTGRLEAPR